MKKGSSTYKALSRNIKLIVSIAATVLILLVLFLAFILVKERADEAIRNLLGPYEVAWVSDGDTITVVIDKAETVVRFIGIDTPESVADESYKENTKEGELAGEYTKTLLENNMVYLEYDTEVKDNYGRDLCYVYLPDKETMVNELLLKNGYARAMTVEPNVRYAERFALLEQEARAQNKGFWGTGFFK